MKMHVMDIDHAVSSLKALRAALAAELDRTERFVEALTAYAAADPAVDADGELTAVYRAACAQLRSGMSSLDEVLGWVHFTAAEECPDHADCAPSVPRLYLVPKDK